MKFNALFISFVSFSICCPTKAIQKANFSPNRKNDQNQLDFQQFPQSGENLMVAGKKVNSAEKAGIEAVNANILFN